MAQAQEEKPYVEHEGVKAFLNGRRRYGGRSGTTYTWLRFFMPDGAELLHDPWPVLTPPKQEVREACARLLNHHLSKLSRCPPPARLG